MPATQTASTARFTFAAGTLVLILAPEQIRKGLGHDEVSGKTMVVVEHRADDDVLLINEAGDIGSKVFVYAGRLIAD